MFVVYINTNFSILIFFNIFLGNNEHERVFCVKQSAYLYAENTITI